MRSCARRPSGRRCAGDAGSSAIEAVLILPALVLLMTAGVQFALYALATHAAALAVEEAGATARSMGGSNKAAISIATADVDAIAGGLLIKPHLSIERTEGGGMDVALSATAPVLIPGLRRPILALSHGPIQEFRPG